MKRDKKELDFWKSLSREENHLEVMNRLLRTREDLHFHAGNMLTFTPLKNLDLTRLCLSAPLDLIIDQAYDGVINKEIIRRNYPSALKLISQQKGLHSLENLVRLEEFPR